MLDGNSNFDKAVATFILIFVSAITIPFLVIFCIKLIRGDFIGMERCPIFIIIGFTLLLLSGWCILLFIR